MSTLEHLAVFDILLFTKMSVASAFNTDKNITMRLGAVYMKNLCQKGNWQRQKVILTA